MTQPPYGPPPQGPPGPGQQPWQTPYVQPAVPLAKGTPSGSPGQFGSAGAHPGPAKKPFWQRPWVIVVAVLLVLIAIGNVMSSNDKEPAAGSAPVTSTSASPPSTAAPATPSQEAPVVAPPVVATPTTAAAPVVDFTMPDFVGMDLQSAQNLVQTYNVFLSVSHDLLGSRNQLVDSNWIVCDQNIPAGQRVTGDVEGKIDFGVVKREESCP